MNEIAFYIVRHGETLLNHLNRAQGWCDSPLTVKGASTARQLAEQFSGVLFSKVFSSDTIRAAHTAQEILSALPESDGQPLTLHQDKRLREWCLGIFEGTDNLEFISAIQKSLQCTSDFAAINSRLPEIADIIYNTDTTGMAEPYTVISKRLLDFLYSEAGAHKDGANILVVTHAFAIKTILYEFAPDLVGQRISNAGILRIVYRDGGFLVNDSFL